MIRATLDVNVLASGFAAETGTPSELIGRWTELEYELVISLHILEGLARAWRKPYYQSRYSSDRAETALRLLRAEATIVEPVTTIRGIAADEEDDLVLATAVAGDVETLVTGDKHLQALDLYQGIAIVSPRQFLETLRLQARPEH